MDRIQTIDERLPQFDQSSIGKERAKLPGTTQNDYGI